MLLLPVSMIVLLHELKEVLPLHGSLHLVLQLILKTPSVGLFNAPLEAFDPHHLLILRAIGLQ